MFVRPGAVAFYFSSYVRALVRSVRPVWHARPDRLWEVDALRGVAILMMVVYHITWDLYGLGGRDIPIYGSFWTVWQRVTAGLFIGLVGVSLHLRAQKFYRQGGFTVWPFVQRALVIGTWAMVITGVTYVFQPDEVVRFGVLHLIGTSLLLALPFVRVPALSLLVGIGLLVLPEVTSWRHHWTWLEWVGMIQAPHPAFDYFPLVPWMGGVFIGVAVGAFLFPKGVPRWSSTSPPICLGRWLQVAGQNALLIYLLHQPLIIAALMLLGYVRLS